MFNVREYFRIRDICCEVSIESLLSIRRYSFAGLYDESFIAEDKIFDVSWNGVKKDEGSYIFVYWRHDVYYIIAAMRLIGINLGNKGKCRGMRVIHVKCICEQNMRVMRDFKHICEESSFFFFSFFSISNSSLQVILNHLKMLELHFIIAHGLKISYIIFEGKSSITSKR